MTYTDTIESILKKYVDARSDYGELSDRFLKSYGFVLVKQPGVTIDTYDILRALQHVFRSRRTLKKDYPPKESTEYAYQEMAEIYRKNRGEIEI